MPFGLPDSRWLLAARGSCVWLGTLASPSVKLYVHTVHDGLPRRLGAAATGSEMRRKHLSSGHHPSGSAADLGDLHDAAFAAPRLPAGDVDGAPTDAQPTRTPHARSARAEPAAGDCASCRSVSRFGNCGDPVAAGLGATFRLIAHPRGGQGCPAYAPVNVEAGVAYWRLHRAHGAVDLAVCPPQPGWRVRRLEPDAGQVEPIAFAEAWPGQG